MKSRSRDQTEGFIDKVGGRILEAWAKLTGKRSTRAKGKAARVRGSWRTTKGRAKAKRR